MTDESNAADEPARLVSFDTTLKGGRLHEVDEQIMEEARTGKGLIRITPEEFMDLAKQAQETMKLFQELFAPMSKEWAAAIRTLRVEHDYSWRAIAAFCNEKWEGNWGSNQLAGMAICERAAQMHNENYMEAPWNGDTSSVLPSS